MLEKINTMCYAYVHEKATFTLEHRLIGACSKGECWCLIMTGVTRITLACFVVRDDGNNVFEECYEKRLWTEDEIVTAANKIITDILPHETVSSTSNEPAFLKKLHNKCYAYMHEKGNFILRNEDVTSGLDGKCWRLYMQSQGVSTELSCFIVQNDERANVCRETFSCNGMLWTEETALKIADKMIKILIDR